MAKFPRISKLSKKEREELFINFCQALASLKNAQEVAIFLKDLVGEAELEMLAKRLEVAKYLIKGKTYQEIASYVKVSHGTVSRVNFWLQVSGAGYRLVTQRSKRKIEQPSQFWQDVEAFKRSHARYFWPELLFEKIIKELGRRKKEKLLDTLNSLENKTKILEEFDNYLRSIYQKKKNKIL